MIRYKKGTLDNGLRVIVHEDASTPFAAFNILYNVGSKNEDPEMTGFAHLFEHLMFGGSLNIPDFDSELQKAGGDSNAFTNPDVTNYFDSLPVSNIETAFWLESDRMLQLDFSQKSLDIQKSVVIEEFKENYINQPYGDLWHNLLQLSYKTHPYKWPTIGKNIEHVANAKLEDVESFFYSYYRPNNAILCVASKLNYDQVMKLAEKWFGEIPQGDIQFTDYEMEAAQREGRKLMLKEDVPVSVIYKTFHMSSRKDSNYYSADLITDLLSNGASGRLNQELVKKKKVFSSAGAYISDSIDPGLIIVEGKLNPSVDIETADKEVSALLYSFLDNISEEELLKVQNKVESSISFSNVELLTRAMNLAYFELLGDIDLINTEERKYRDVTVEEVKKYGKKILAEQNCSTLYYLAK